MVQRMSKRGPLIIYNWGEYGPVDSNLAGFQEELGVKARIEFFQTTRKCSLRSAPGLPDGMSLCRRTIRCRL